MTIDSPLPPTQNQAESQKMETAEWKALVAEFAKPSLPRSIWQIVNTFVPLIGLWVLMYYTMVVRDSFLLTLPLALLAGLFLIRVFIIFHDCGHGSYLKNRTAMDVLGFISGLLTFTPYFHWRWEHSLHHATSGDLDRRGVGDVWTMTVQEYLESSRWKRFSYQLLRNPFVLFVIAPLFLFFIYQRIPKSNANPRERLSVWWMNLALVVMAVAMSAIFGWKNYLLLQLIVTAFSSSLGVWMFYVQHQFEGTYWERGEDWDYMTAALKGSSFYKLPRILQWFTGNIGYHHIHHLSARIPNYNLQRCHESHPLFHSVKPITLLSSLKSFTFRLWDESRRELVGYRRMREMRREQQGMQQSRGA